MLAILTDNEFACFDIGSFIKKDNFPYLNDTSTVNIPYILRFLIKYIPRNVWRYRKGNQKVIKR